VLPILVTGATGTQGGATARSLLAAGGAVRFLTRRPESPQARELIRLGAVATVGDYDDPVSLDRATRGVVGVFSVQARHDPSDSSERRHALALIEAASGNGVAQFVHTTVAGAGRHERFPRWQEGHWNKAYWTDKWQTEQAARTAGFHYWTVLKPAFFMDNFSQPKAAFLFPDLATGRIATALRNTTRIQMVCADDIGAFACSAFQHPEQYHGKSINLAVETRTMPEVARILTEVTGREISVAALTPEQASERGRPAGWVRSQEWYNEVGDGRALPDLTQYHIP